MNVGVVFTRLLVALVLMISAVDLSLAATDTRKEVRDARSKPLIRGAIVYKAYCVLCHGEKADGVARATKLYGQKNLVVSANDREYNERIIRAGGLAVGKSEFMPTWEDELTDDQINDLLDYLSVVGDPALRGEIVYKTNCVLCHGMKGDGKGRASILYDPPPADLTRSDKNDMYKSMIITMGGKAMGRSEVMPVWGEQLTAQEIEDVVGYLKTILVIPAPE